MGVGEPTKILFGTDGWRAKIGDEFTFENVRRLAEGVARVVEEDGATAKSVVIAYDRRFGSEEFAIAAAEILLAHRCAHADGLVRGGDARRGDGYRHYRQPQPVDG